MAPPDATGERLDDDSAHARHSWQFGGGPLVRGLVELRATGLRLAGCAADVPVVFADVLYDDLEDVHVERTGGRPMRPPCLVLETTVGPSIRIASLDGPGIIGELADRVASLLPHT